MAISRRQFFRGLVGQSEDREREFRKRISALEAYVQTTLLPYDFALTAEQAAEALGAAVEGIDVEGSEDLFTHQRLTRIHEIVDTKVQKWREEYLRAEDARREAMAFVPEFLKFQASEKDLHSLEQRFSDTSLGALNEQLERQLRVRLSDFPNVQLANCTPSELRELVFSEIRSWC